ncbi:MAG: anhydro-N-acetylmuramic acid kinase [Edaphobacter sp.]|uniref:anhydro-N-acetylmuramic acid kinase n=1 Tax=Edaphobacter sp. TaxID=1934404 RepID=UPI0023A4B335|nr:anhydro-N-acetylmuramic acid kinase [Edaphobacter sp.]MDE1177419.1 anhydro-N-acetylmuramic acid kinase [Edaphobacter sp.]
MTKAKAMIVAGVMSGTSADGVDVALCRIAEGTDGVQGSPKVKLLGMSSMAYPKPLREAVLAAMDAKSIAAAELSRLHWRLGEVYADAVAKAQVEHGVKAQLVGCHGQTIYHQGAATKYLGRPVRATWQIGEASVIAERLRVTVVSDFRPADLAAGGQGAPLVPMLDYVLFRSAKMSRVLQNLGGIANMTSIPAGATAETVMAFDSGPANVVIDSVMLKLFGKTYDRNGATAKRGRPVAAVIERLKQDAYFVAAPPKSCGREEFAGEYIERFMALCLKARASDADIVATATALTSETILEAYRSFVWPHLGQLAPMARGVEYIVAGGGAKNALLMKQLRAGLEPLGVTVRTMDELGIPAQAKEGMAFALMAWLTAHGRPGNIPSATGASRPVVLGKVTHA